MAINLRHVPKSVKLAALAAMPDMQGKALREIVRTAATTRIARGKRLTGFAARHVAV